MFLNKERPLKIMKNKTKQNNPVKGTSEAAEALTSKYFQYTLHFKLSGSHSVFEKHSRLAPETEPDLVFYRHTVHALINPT